MIGAPLVGTMTGFALATTSAVPYPAGITAGMLLTLHVTSGGAVLVTNPSGWTQVDNRSEAGIAPVQYVGIKVADGTESGTLTVTHGNFASSGQILAFPGVDTTTPQDVAATVVDTTVASTDTVIPSLTTSRPGVALAYFGAHASTTDTATPPASPATFTETGDLGATRAATTGYLVWGSSGATGTVTIVWNGSNKGLGVLLALRPAADVARWRPTVPGRNQPAAWWR